MNKFIDVDGPVKTKIKNSALIICGHNNDYILQCVKLVDVLKPT